MSKLSNGRNTELLNLKKTMKKVKEKDTKQ